MRVDRSAEGEARDALSQDWGAFLSAQASGVPWLPIPNLGTGAVSYLLQWKIDAVILSGGNDMGACAVRDLTEFSVLDHCSRLNLPVLGVCRGLHVLQRFYGGEVEPLSAEHSASREHLVEACEPSFLDESGRTVWRVNSYHRMGVKLCSLAPPLRPLLISRDECVEGLFHGRKHQMAVQWHPERKLTDRGLAVRIVRSFLNGWR
jgi:N5-(cytidine 5'-diphosphoramidyl)-L-glutamine hydrolase